VHGTPVHSHRIEESPLQARLHHTLSTAKHLHAQQLGALLVSWFVDAIDVLSVTVSASYLMNKAGVGRHDRI